jgi:hypothetical protein
MKVASKKTGDNFIVAGIMFCRRFVIYESYGASGGNIP